MSNAISLTSLQELNQIAWSLRDNDPVKSRQLSQQTFEESEKHKHDLEKAYALTTLSFLDFREYEYRKSLQKYLEALALFETKGEKRWLPWLYNIYALIQNEVGHRPKSLEYLLKQVELAKQFNHPEQEAIGYHDLALFYYDDESYAVAEEYFDKALKLCQRHQDKRTEAFIYLNRSISLMKENELLDAEALVKRCIHIAQSNTYKRIERYAMKTLGEIHSQQRQLEPAQQCYKRALELSSECNEAAEDIYLGLSNIEYQEGNLDKAIDYAQQALTFYDKSGHKLFLRDTHQGLVKLYRAQGAFEKALEHFETYHQLHISIFSVRNEERIRLMEFDYQTNILRQQAEQMKQQHLELQERHRQIEALSVRDPLTNLFNRRYLFEYSEKIISQSQRYQHDLAIAMIDIDFFKRVNDTFSHFIGDKVLVAVADVFQSMLRKADTVARAGGEEFVIVFPYTNVSSATLVCQRIRQKIQDYNWKSIHPDLQVTLSIGVAGFRNNSFQELLNEADQMLYQAKHLGRNQVYSADKPS